MALVRIYNAGLKCAARGSLEMQDPKKSLKIRHLCTVARLLSGYVFAKKPRIDNRKKN